MPFSEGRGAYMYVCIWGDGQLKHCMFAKYVWAGLCCVCLCDVRVSGMYKNKKMYFMIPACVCSMLVSVLV